MADGVRIELLNERELRRALQRIDPSENVRIQRDALLESAFLVQENAASKQIIRGGRQRPDPKRLTSRTGTGRRSISVFRQGLARSRALYVEVGPKGVAEQYMSLHERGGVVRRRAHKRSKPSGGVTTVRAHTARYPRRAFLEPALNESRTRIRNAFLRRWDLALRAASDSTR